MYFKRTVVSFIQRIHHGVRPSLHGDRDARDDRDAHDDRDARDARDAPILHDVRGDLPILRILYEDLRLVLEMRTLVLGEPRA